MSTQYNIFEDKELLEYLGRALYECQLLEVNLAYIIRDSRLIKGKIRGQDLDEYLQELDNVLNKRLEQPLGCLINEFQSLDPLDQDSKDLDLLKKALNQRNDTVHAFFYKHWIVALVPVARYVMIGELKEAIETISDAIKLTEIIKQKLRAKLESDTDNSNAPV